MKYLSSIVPFALKHFALTLCVLAFFFVFLPFLLSSGQKNLIKEPRFIGEFEGCRVYEFRYRQRHHTVTRCDHRVLTQARWDDCVPIQLNGVTYPVCTEETARVVVEK